jgi:hypothetical protein
MTLFKKFLIVLTLLIANYASALTITGVVTDKHTSLPVVNAEVTLLKENVSGVTNSSGRFSLTSKASSLELSNTISISNNKYWTKEVSIDPLNASNIEIKLQAEKARLIITTDIGGEDPDDLQSLIHALLLSNEFDLEGIVYGHAWVDSNLERGRKRIESAIAAYEKVYPNLKVHDEAYPTPEYLRSIVKSGQSVPTMAGTGKGQDSEGLRWQIEKMILAPFG